MHPQTYIGLCNHGKSALLKKPVDGIKFPMVYLKKFIHDNFPQSLGSGRKKEIVWIRHSLQALAYENRNFFIQCSYTAIGRIFKRDHATVMHACNNIDHWLKHPEPNQDRIKVYNEVRDSFTAFLMTVHAVEELTA